MLNQLCLEIQPASDSVHWFKLVGDADEDAGSHRNLKGLGDY